MTSTKSREINSIISEMISSYSKTLTDKAKMRRCFQCGEPFKLNNSNRYYCSKTCSRLAHYLKFSIRKGK